VKKGQKLASSYKLASGNENISVEQMDLSSQKSMKDFVNKITEKFEKVDVLVNNAAVCPPKKELTLDGLESQFGINIYSYYFLMKSFIPLLKKSSNPRVVNVASNYAGELNLDDLEFKSRPYDPTAAYKQSKQANRQLTSHAASLYKDDGINIYACHPGVVSSTLLSSLGMRKGFDTPEAGAATPLHLATSKKVTSKDSGSYWYEQKKVECPFQKDKKESAGLWKYLEETETRLTKDTK